MSGYTSNELFGRPDKNGRVNPNRMIPFEKCVEILDDCKELGTKAIQATGGGEPTIHPQHKEVFQGILDRGMDLALVTNGVTMHEPLREILMEASWVRVSIDAGIEETYSSIREVRPQVFHDVLKNIGDLVELKQKKNAKQLLVGIGFVVTKENWREVLLCTTIAKKLGVDNLRISAIFQSEGVSYFDGWLNEASELCREAAAETTPTFKVFNNFSNRVEDLEQAHPDYEFCGLQNIQTYIGGDLNVYRCCVTSYNPRGLIGSLQDQRFYDLWMKKELNKGFDARGCPRCMYNDKNRTILYAIDTDAMHKNFV